MKGVFWNGRFYSIKFERAYFYYINERGELFNIEKETKKMPYGPFYIKERSVLNFFFKRLKKNESGENTEWPYSSPCGKEINFVKCKDSPIVFHTLIREEGNEGENEEHYLLYGFDLKFPFQPSLLASNSEGKLFGFFLSYFPFSTDKASPN